MRATTPEPKHIFVQVNTDNIISIFESNASNGDVILENTIIYDQGSMALGSPIVDFAIGVEAWQDVYFTILPVKLFTYDKAYFTGFKIDSQTGMSLPDCKWDEGVLSFSINTGNAEANGFAVFSLIGKIDYMYRKEAKSISIAIDPVLRVIQR